MKKIVFLTAIFVFMLACQEKKSFDDLMTYSSSGKPHFIVMNPAGSVEKFQYDHNTNGFRVRTDNGINEILSFLPFPANYGFFPSTHTGGANNGELLYGFMISPTYSIQTMLEAKPIGAVSVIKEGKEHQIIFCVPDDKSLRLDAKSPKKLDDNIRVIFETWLMNGFGIDSIVNWHDAEYAEELIKSRSNR